MKNFSFVLAVAVLTFGLGAPAYAEDIEEVSEPVVEEVPAEEPVPEPTPEPSYVPPPEAYEGVGGWAAVNPNTGKVHGVIVGTIESYHSVNNHGGLENYMGCGQGCVLRFQSRAQEGGNVVGIFSDGYNEVTFDGDSEGTFSVSLGNDNEGGASSRTGATLDPSQTMLDGQSLDTGYRNKVTDTVLESGAKIKVTKEDYFDAESETKVLLPDWKEGGQLFTYLSELRAKESLQEDVDSELIAEGYTAEEIFSSTLIDEETGEEVVTETTRIVLDEDNVFVKTVKAWAAGVLTFLEGIFS